MDGAVRVALLIGLVSTMTVAAAPSGDKISHWSGFAAECQRSVGEDAGRPYRFHDHADVVETFKGSRTLPASEDRPEDERMPCVELK